MKQKMKSVVPFLALLCGVMGLMMFSGDVPALGAEAVATAPAFPAIPGITEPDRFPNACVECHKFYPEHNKDFRLTTVLTEWSKATDPKFLKKAQAAVTPGVTLKGKHPNVQELVQKIPTDCLMCHHAEAKTVPPFSRLLHLIHLENVKENHFLANYGGQCTHCHKLDKTSGEWGLGSGTALWGKP